MINIYYKKFLSIYVTARLKNLDNTKVSDKFFFNRIAHHQNKMPDFLSFGLKTVATLFYFKIFLQKFFIFENSIEPTLIKARKSRLSVFRSLIRFHDSLFEVANVIEKDSNYFKSPPNLSYNKINDFDFIIIGSGPGGAVSASKLVNAGYKTAIIERGRIISENSIKPFSYSEMLNRYRCGGITTTLGNCNISYVEGDTWGGGSEINSGLYHRTPPDVLRDWKNKFGLKNVEMQDLEKYFEQIESDLCISYFPNGLIPKASMKLKYGAEKLNWDVKEIPRWFKYDGDNSTDGQKMTMSKTYLSQFTDNGGTILEMTKAIKIMNENKSWALDILSNDKKQRIFSKNIIISAGTINTPFLLRGSGLSDLAGKNFKMHPTIKVVALFDEAINSENMGVPVHQVKEFAPEISFGCSISSKPYLRVAMLDHFDSLELVEKSWKKMAIYYAMIMPEGKGSINPLPFFNDPLVLYNLTDKDKENLSFGLKKLCELLFNAGAVKLFPGSLDIPTISNFNDIDYIPNMINPKRSSLMTIHLFSSCPIGENRNQCVANSYGKVFNQEGLYICDGSILPSAPGVNPQGTIMALAHRNIDNIIVES